MCKGRGDVCLCARWGCGYLFTAGGWGGMRREDAQEIGAFLNNGVSIEHLEALYSRENLYQ